MSIKRKIKKIYGSVKTPDIEERLFPLPAKKTRRAPLKRAVAFAACAALLFTFGISFAVMQIKTAHNVPSPLPGTATEPASDKQSEAAGSLTRATASANLSAACTTENNGGETSTAHGSVTASIDSSFPTTEHTSVSGGGDITAPSPSVTVSKRPDGQTTYRITEAASTNKLFPTGNTEPSAATTSLCTDATAVTLSGYATESTAPYRRTDASSADTTLYLSDTEATTPCSTSDEPPADKVFFFSSYDELYENIKDEGSELYSEEYSSSVRYKVLMKLFKTGKASLKVPAVYGEPLELGGSDGTQKTALLTRELFDFPWIWYYCRYDDRAVTVCVTYFDSIGKYYDGKIDSVSVFFKRFDPNAAMKSEAKIKTVSINGRPTEVLVYGKPGERIRYFLVTDGCLVSVWNYEPSEIGEDFWDGFSLVNYN